MAAAPLEYPAIAEEFRNRRVELNRACDVLMSTGQYEHLTEELNTQIRHVRQHCPPDQVAHEIQLRMTAFSRNPFIVELNNLHKSLSGLDREYHARVEQAKIASMPSRIREYEHLEGRRFTTSL